MARSALVVSSSGSCVTAAFVAEPPVVDVELPESPVEESSRRRSAASTESYSSARRPRYAHSATPPTAAADAARVVSDGRSAILEAIERASPYGKDPQQSARRERSSQPAELASQLPFPTSRSTRLL